MPDKSRARPKPIRIKYPTIRRSRYKTDLAGVIALALVILGSLYLFLGLFSPRRIPSFLRFGVPHTRLNVLVMGTDIVYDQHHAIISASGRTDTMMLVQIDPSREKIYLLSIPRDTLVEIPGFGYQKINAANVLGGPNLAKEAVSKLLKVSIDRYALLNPPGLIRLVDILGGVRVYVDRDMRYVDYWGHLNINFKKGWRNLSGEEANEFLRFRHEAMGDIGRISRQQEFLQALAKKLASPAVFLKSPLILGIAAGSLKTDLSPQEIAFLANFARMLKKSDIQTFTLPGTTSEEKYAASYWLADLKEGKKIIHQYFLKSYLQRWWRELRGE